MIIPELADSFSQGKTNTQRSNFLKSDDEIGILTPSQQSLAEQLQQRGGGALAGVKTAEVEGALPDPTKGIPQAEFQAMTPEAQTRFQQQGGIVQPEPTETPTSPAERFIERATPTERLETAAEAGLETGKEALELGGKGVQDIARAFTTDEATIGQRVADLGAGAAEVAGGALGGAIATPFAGLAGLFEPEIEATVQAGVDVAKDQLVQTAINQGATPENAEIIANEVIGESVQAVTGKMEQAKTALSSVFGEERADNLVKSAAFALEAIGIEEGVPAAKKLVKETGEAVVKAAPKVAGAVAKGAEVAGEVVEAGVRKGEDIVTGAIETVAKKSAEKELKKIDDIIKKGIEKGIRPTIRGKKTLSDVKKFEQSANDAVRTIVERKDKLNLVDEFGEAVELPENLQQFSQSIDKAKKDVFEEYTSLIRQAGNDVKISTEDIAKKLDEVANSKLTQTTRPEISNSAKAAAERWRALGEITPEEADALIKDLNQSLQSFYTSGTNKAQSQVDASIASLLRSRLDDTISSATGKEFQAIKSKYGSLKAIEKDTLNRALIDARKNTQGLLDFTDIFTGGEIASGVLTGNIGQVAKGTVGKAFKEYFKFVNDPNNVIKNMFKNVDKSLQKGFVNQKDVGITKNLSK